MKIIGLTGSIGMGKSATAQMFRDFGIPVHDADAAVHQLYRGAATPLIEEAFPGTTRDGVVDRDLLGKRVLGDDKAMKALEAIIHPLVRQADIDFRSRAEADGADMVVMDVPLLFETGGDKRCDVIVVVSAPEHLQRERVLARPGMSKERFEAILARQVPDHEKRRRAHYVVDTSRGFDDAREQVRKLIAAIRESDQG